MSIDYRLKLLESMEKMRDWLHPSISKISKYGYYYPSACEIFSCAQGEELGHLEFLSQNQYLDRQFFDKVHICPRCLSYQLNFREICPSCHSSNLLLTKQLHHYSCGYVAPETKFRQGLEFKCPKCHEVLRHIGIDYSEPSEVFLCYHCDATSPDSDISCLCFNCENIFDVSCAIKQTLYSYKINVKGVEALERGLVKENVQQFIEIDFP